ncbi:IS5 family transposase [Candidatus Odyssella acanthamoebae]|uniref:IS5 family transposase n=1 Tax=Candidatus Odyssella acanthamoebae TaxID=91604 RepID=UPI0006895335|nr:IS5 family transposase [Candidatus Paracaedibacter acanthamoebae]
MKKQISKFSNKKISYKVTNWHEYNKALKQRGSLTVWLSEDLDESWLAPSTEERKRGRPLVYSQACINLLLTFRHLFKLALRQVIGFIESLFTLSGKILPVPEFSRLSKRAAQALSCLHLPSLNEPTHLVIDSTGLKVFGEKEWLETKHGKQYNRKVWRKLHIGVEEGGYITARVLTDHHTDDRACVPSLIDQSNASYITDCLADGGYDSHQIYKFLEDQTIKPFIPPPSQAVVRSKTNPSTRDQTVKYIKEKGYWAWYYKNDLGRRNKVENTFYRLKTIFGRKLSSRILPNQDAESHLVCCMLNKMTSLGMPKSVKAY